MIKFKVKCLCGATAWISETQINGYGDNPEWEGGLEDHEHIMDDVLESEVQDFE